MTDRTKALLVDLLIGIAITIVLFIISGCTEKMPDSVCVRSHTESITTVVPILTGFSNNIPQYIYMPQTSWYDECDEARPLTQAEKDAWTKEHSK